MPQKFDATFKDLVQSHPRDWLAFLGVPAAGPVEVLTPDLSTVSAFADIVLRVTGGLLHLDAQVGPDANLAGRMLLYNVLIHDRYGEPVHTVVLLLDRRGDRSDLTGTHRYELLPGQGGLDFRFQVIRIWEVPVETLLAAGVCVAPLALLGRLPKGRKAAWSGLAKRVTQRIKAEAPPDEGELLVATLILAGLRLTTEQLRQLFQGVPGMRESAGYQLILEEGRVEEARGTLLRLASRRFGAPTEAQTAALQAIMDLERLHRVTDRIHEAADWEDLLATP